MGILKAQLSGPPKNTLRNSETAQYLCINKIYNILGLSLNEGNVLYNVSHSEILQMNKNEIKTNPNALGGPIQNKVPSTEVSKVSQKESRNPILREYISAVENSMDFENHAMILELLKTLAKMIAWIYDNATIIAVIHIILVLVVFIVVFGCKYTTHNLL